MSFSMLSMLNTSPHSMQNASVSKMQVASTCAPHEGQCISDMFILFLD